MRRVSNLGAGEAFDGAIFEKPVSLNITVTVRELVLAVGLTRNHPLHFSLLFFFFPSLSQTAKAEPRIEAGISASGLCLCQGEGCFHGCCSRACLCLALYIL